MSNMNRTATRSPFIIRVQGRDTGKPGNMWHINCDTLQAAVIRLAREMSNEENHKVEFLAVLETFTRN